MEVNQYGCPCSCTDRLHSLFLVPGTAWGTNEQEPWVGSLATSHATFFFFNYYHFQYSWLVREMRSYVAAADAAAGGSC